MRLTIRIGSLMAGALLGAALSLPADTGANPYLTITDRNAFGLKPIIVAPPVDMTAPKEPEKLAIVELTGITTLFSNPKALVEISEAPGKPPKKLIMHVGDRVDSVELLEIDVKNIMVKVRNGSVVTNVELRAPKSTPTPATPAAPGTVPRVAVAAPPPPPTAAPQVFDLGGGGPAGRGGGVVVAGAAPASSATIPTAAATFAASPAASGIAVTDGGGLRSIPARVPRTSTTGAATDHTVDLAKQIIMLKAQQIQAAQEGRSLPPLPHMPGID